MAFSYNQLPLVVSFYDALERFNTTKPIRGRAPEVRPLGIRRRHEASIDARRDDHGEIEYVDLKLYGDKVISFWKHEPYVMVIHSPDSNKYFASTTTASFIKETTGFGCLLNDGKLKFYVGGKHQATTIYPIFDGMKIERAMDTGTPRLNVLNPEPTHAYRADRKALREEMEKYQPFVEYVTSMSKIMNKLEIDLNSESGKKAQGIKLDVGGFNKTYLREFAKIASTDRDKLNGMMQHTSYQTMVFKSQQKAWIEVKSFLEAVNVACNIKDYEAMSDLYKVLAYNAGEGWRRGWRAGNRDTSIEISCVPVTLLARFRDLVKLIHAHKVFRKEELPEGKDIRDNNEVFVLFNTIFN